MGSIPITRSIPSVETPSAGKSRHAALPLSAAIGVMNMIRHDKTRPLMQLWPFLRPHRGQLSLAVLAMFVTSVLSLALPLTVRQIVDGFSQSSPQSVDTYFIIALLLAVLLALATGARYTLVTRLGEQVIADIRKSVFGKVVGLSPAFFEELMTGEVISRINTDTTLVQTVIDTTVSVAVRNSLLLAGGLLLMLWTSPTLSLLAIMVVPLVLLPLLGLGRKLRTLSRTNQDKIADTAARASETLQAVQAVQANTNEAESVSSFSRLVDISLEAARKRIHVRALLTVSIILLVFCSVVAVIWAGVGEVRSGEMSAGLLIQFVIYAVMVASSAAAISEVWGELQRAAGASERLFELLEAEDPVVDPEDAVLPSADPEGEIAFDDVKFNYPARPGVAALDGVSFRIRRGETVALVGPSGAGKSTVFQLALRFFDPRSGSIRIDGIDIRRMHRQHFRRLIALVPQEPAIFSTTARENIRFGRPGATDHDVEEAARASHIHDFLSGLPDGYDTLVGERGIMLSGGQRQRIAIARAILRNAPILLLDEATSSLDPESESLIQQAVEQLSAERTTLIIAHRLATVQMAGRILVFDQGRIIADGSHKELVDQGGLYARFAELQFNPGASAASFRLASGSQIIQP